MKLKLRLSSSKRLCTFFPWFMILWLFIFFIESVKIKKTKYCMNQTAWESFPELSFP